MILVFENEYSFFKKRKYTRIILFLLIYFSFSKENIINYHRTSIQGVKIKKKNNNNFILFHFFKISKSGLMKL